MSCFSPSNTPWVQSIVEKGYKVGFFDLNYGSLLRTPRSSYWINEVVNMLRRDLLLVNVPPGTGLSSPISARTLGLEGGPEEQARLLKLFRADNIGEQAFCR